MNYSEKRECGCKITLVEASGELLGINLDYCPRHAAADEMYESLKEILDCETFEYYGIAQAALARATAMRSE